MTHLLSKKKIAIIGGGPGGLTLARLLQQQNTDVTIYERDTDRHARMQGATLDLHQASGLKAIKAAGLLDAFQQHYRPGADMLRITDKQARVLYDQHTETQHLSFDAEHFRPEIDRGPLRDILLDSLLPGTVAWGHQLKSLIPEQDGWRLTFQNDTTAYADIVVGADGARSKIRPLITPVTARYAGVTIVEGTLKNAASYAPALVQLTGGGKVFAMGHERSLILSAKGDGALSFYTGCKTEENWASKSGIDFADSQQVYEWFAGEFGGWHPVWQELFAGAATECVVRPQYCMPTDQTWEAQHNITMLGDAAHLMPPYAGEGVNMAMLDALELSEHLTNNTHNNIREAIAAYESAMRQRAAEVATETMHNTEIIHSPQGLQWMVNAFTGHE